MNFESEFLMYPFLFDNNSDRFDSLLHIIEPCQFTRHMSGLESNSHYSDNLLCLLLDNYFEIGLINPISTDDNRGEKIRKTKNDT